jgi:hypothetical protein
MTQRTEAKKSHAQAEGGTQAEGLGSKFFSQPIDEGLGRAAFLPGIFFCSRGARVAAPRQPRHRQQRTSFGRKYGEFAMPLSESSR